MKNLENSTFALAQSLGAPEQLELFKFVEPQAEGAVYPQVWQEISNAACHCYVHSLTSEAIAGLGNSFVQQQPGPSSASIFYDYLVGAGMALNPMPLITPPTFLSPDRIALAFDSHIVQRDLSDVWHAISLAKRYAAAYAKSHAEGYANERQSQRERPKEAARAASK